MEQVFKTKWVPDWQYVGMGVAILVVIVIFFWLQEWTALGGLIVPLMLFYSQSKTIYTIKDSGVLEGLPAILLPKLPEKPASVLCCLKREVWEACA